MSEHLTKDAIDLSTLSIPRLFGRYFLPTLFGMLSISAMCAIDGIFVGHAVGADGIGAINICVPIMMLATGLGLMMGAGCSVVASIHMAEKKLKAARINVMQAWIFTSIVILASLAESVVWYGGLLRPCYSGVCGEAVETLVYYLLHSVATTDESDKHEHAPEHAESGEEGARFVAG